MGDLSSRHILYAMFECVGAGAFGRVHLARKVGESVDYALKEVPLTPLSDSIGWVHYTLVGNLRPHYYIFHLIIAKQHIT